LGTQISVDRGADDKTAADMMQCPNPLGAWFPSLSPICTQDGPAPKSYQPFENDSTEINAVIRVSAVVDDLDGYDPNKSSTGVKEDICPLEFMFDESLCEEDVEEMFDDEAFRPTLCDGSHLLKDEDVEEVLLSREDVEEMWLSAQMNSLVHNPEVLRCDSPDPYTLEMQHFNVSPHEDPKTMPSGTEGNFADSHLNTTLLYKVGDDVSVLAQDLALVATETPKALAVLLCFTALVGISLTWIFKRMPKARTTITHGAITPPDIESPSSASTAETPVSTSATSVSPAAVATAGPAPAITRRVSHALAVNNNEGDNRHILQPVLHHPVSPGAHSMSTSAVTMDSASTQGDRDLTQLFDGLVGHLSESLESHRRNLHSQNSTFCVFHLVWLAMVWIRPHSLRPLRS